MNRDGINTNNIVMVFSQLSIRKIILKVGLTYLN